jgi:hypothetical protein
VLGRETETEVIVACSMVISCAAQRKHFHARHMMKSVALVTAGLLAIPISPTGTWDMTFIAATRFGGPLVEPLLLTEFCVRLNGQIRLCTNP